MEQMIVTAITTEVSNDVRKSVIKMIVNINSTPIIRFIAGAFNALVHKVPKREPSFRIY
jgi:hypothetical protein